MSIPHFGLKFQRGADLCKIWSTVSSDAKKLKASKNVDWSGLIPGSQCENIYERPCILACPLISNSISRHFLLRNNHRCSQDVPRRMNIRSVSNTWKHLKYRTVRNGKTDEGICLSPDN